MRFTSESEYADNQQHHKLDEEFIKLLLSLDFNAWRVFYDNYFQMVCDWSAASLVKVGQSADNQEDIAQETLKEAFKQVKKGKFQLKAGDSPENFLHWVRRICKFQASQMSRKSKRRPATQPLDLSEETSKLVIEKSQTPDNLISRKHVFEHALNQLSPRDREILLDWTQGDTPQMLSSRYDIPASQISQILDRAKKKIKRSLSGNDHPDY